MAYEQNFMPTEADYINYIDPIEHPGTATLGYKGFNPPDRCPRTAIGWRSSDNKIIMANVNNATFYETRQVFKEYIGCTEAIMLDGGGSSQIKGKVVINPNTGQTQDIFTDYEPESIGPLFSMVTIKAGTSWTNS